MVDFARASTRRLVVTAKETRRLLLKNPLDRCACAF